MTAGPLAYKEKRAESSIPLVFLCMFLCLLPELCELNVLGCLCSELLVL